MECDPDNDDGLEMDSLKCLVLRVASSRSCDDVIGTIVRELARRPAVGLARIWLVEPGDLCDVCPMRPECADRTRCLHLVASAGNSLVDPDADWTRLDGEFRRIPVGDRKVGRIAATGLPVEVPRIAEEPGWIAKPDWAEREGIVGFGGQPLVFEDQVLGVLGVFTREELVPQWLIWLRMLADHAAAAIVNARAFEEIERLKRTVELENEYLRQEVRAAHAFGDIVGRSPALTKVLAQIELVAPTDSSVLVLGESGVGKELIARAIHERSSRASRPLIKVNCASIPRELFESEFFGHVKGAFTGAVRDRAGRFELADGGTLFLDEVGEIPLELQGKLLRVLQEGSFEKIGDEVTRTVDVRIIAATNRDLRAEVDARRFREDLYYRLSVFPLEVPPLRDRMDDVPSLVEHFLDEASRRFGVPTPVLKRRHVVELTSYRWPGNVRELQNVVQRAVIVARGGPLRFDLPDSGGGSGRSRSGGPGAVLPEPGEILTYDELRDLERANVLAALGRTEWKISGTAGAAAVLGLRPTTLSSRMKSMGIERPR